jgi:resuscitation-promoting factor RpfB
MRKLLIFLICAITIAACRPPRETPQIRVTLRADGREKTFSYPVPVTVDEFLSDPDVDVQVTETDRINPSRFTQISDGMLVTVVRVTENSECERTDIPYKQTTIPNEALQPGEQQVGQAGQNGILETCYRITLEDGIESDRVKVSETEILAPQDEIISVGPSGEIEPVPIIGTIAYINNGNAWVISDSSTTKRLLTDTSDVDTRHNTFSLSPDGRQLLFARKTTPAQESTSFNQLWLIPDIAQESAPISLVPSDILYADWIPGRQNTIVYSTGEATEAAPGWLAYNDLWEMRIDPQSGGSVNVDAIVERSLGGLYGWWGTRFQWSPDGQQLVWVQADSVGLVDLESGELGTPLLTYPEFRTVADWSWRATISWSPDSALFTTTIHGAPVGREIAENSPAFNVAVADANGFSAEAVMNAGIWSAPKYSPFVSNPNSEFPQGYLAYLRAKDPFNSINGEYELVVADRDGSNARVVFPQDGQPGLTAQQSIFQNQEFTWSPDGRQIAFIYQGNLWVIDVESEVAHQLTLDGGASNPVWTQ